MKLLTILVLSLTTTAIPINITTYSYLTYEVSRFIYVNSKQYLNSNVNEYIFPVHISNNKNYIINSLILLNDFERLKLNHDYNNVLYCLMKYFNDHNNSNELVVIDEDLKIFINNNKSTDFFLEKIIKNKLQVKELLKNLKLNNNHDELLKGKTEKNYKNLTNSVNFINLYELTPNIYDTFKYQIFHKIHFNHPNIDLSIRNSLNFIYNNDSFLIKNLLKLLNELNQNQNVSNDLQIRSENNWFDIKFQLNFLIILNIVILSIKLMELMNGLSLQKFLFISF